MSETTNRKRVKVHHRTVTVSDDWPWWIGGTKRQWLARKRRDARAVERALNDMLTGAAHLTKYGVRDVGVMLTTARQWRKALRGVR